ncbi:class A beta-lactamase [Sphingosinicella humi]|uniref:class A beta-lactamase n=1 Tax=Allosphingosinicella humi TaxID=2068657 RepID=UPI001A9C44B8|nr:class A beta-lactamase [Sphingosinicella humi]
MTLGRQIIARRKLHSSTTTAFIAALSVSALLAACIPQARSAEVAATPKARPAVASTQTQTALPQPAPSPAPVVPATVLTAQRILDARINELGRAFNGDIGIAVKDIQTGWTSHYDGTTWYPQQSVSKFWVALTALAEVDKGNLSLATPVTLGRDDLTLFHQPIRAMVLSGGYTTTPNDLLHRAIQQSDNTANDFLLWRAGGPEAVRAYLDRMNIEGIRFGPGERALQSKIAGLEWKSSYSIGNNFYAARNAVPDAVRRQAFESYIANPMDGATPLGIVDALARLKKGELLSPSSTALLLEIMSNTRTGPTRLKGGLSGGWRLAHKTGTGQVFKGEQAGYNDIGIVTSPSGHSYAVAVLIRRTSAPNIQRMRTMQDTVRAIIDYHENLQGYTIAIDDREDGKIYRVGG